MLVDGNNKHRDELAGVLTEKKYKIYTSKNAREALDIIVQFSIQVVVMELDFPDMDGIELLREIKAYKPQIECIILTGSATQDSAIKAINLGTFNYLEKPHNIDQLVLSINQALEKINITTELANSEERFRSLYENATIGIYRSTPSGKIQLANPALINMLGYTDFFELSKRNLGKKLYFRGKTRNDFQRLIDKDGIVHGFEAAWEKKDGSLVYIRESAKAVKDELGNVLYYEGTVEDVSERRAAKLKLIESEQRYRNLVEMSPLGIVAVDLFGFIRSVNSTALKITGYTEEDLVGMHFTKLSGFKLKDIPLLNTMYKRFRNNEEIGPVEVEWKFKDGSVHYILAHSGPILIDGEVQGLQATFSDITVTRQAEREIALSQENLSNVFNLTPDAIIIQDKNNEIVAVNDAAIRLFGYSREELLTDKDIVLADRELTSRDRAQALAKLALGGKPQRFEWFGKRKDGSSFTEEIVLNRTIFNGEAVLMITIRDITDRKQAEEDLKTLVLEWQTTFDAISDAIWLINVDGKIVRYNKATTDWLHYSKEDIKNRCCWELVHGTKQPIPACPLLEMKKTGKRATKELELNQRWIEVTVDPIIKKGTIIGAVHVIKDITDRKLTENALVSSEERFRTLVNESPAGIYLTDQEGNCVFVNCAWSKMTGMKAEDTLGGGWFRGIHPDDHARVRELWQSQSRQQENWTMDFRLLDKQGRITWISGLVTKLFDSTGKLTGYLSINSDITERVTAEQEVREYSSRLKELSNYLRVSIEKERTRIAREIHDELGQALTAIKIDLGLIKSDIGNNDTVLDRLVNLDALVDTTITQTRRISADLRPSILDDLGLLPALEWYLDDFAKRTGIIIDISIDITDEQVPDDYTVLIYRLVQETLTNVARHANATEIRLVIWAADGMLELEISDNGVGITPEKLKDSHSLGLIGMQERIGFVDGKIEISGQKGRGTTVKVELPLNI